MAIVLHEGTRVTGTVRVVRVLREGTRVAEAARVAQVQWPWNPVGLRYQVLFCLADSAEDASHEVALECADVEGKVDDYCYTCLSQYGYGRGTGYQLTLVQLCNSLNARWQRENLPSAAS